MAGYQRKISYLYSYKDDMMTKNIGYVRMEVRDAHTKFYIYMKGMYTSGNEDCTVYILMKEGDKLRRIRAGEFQVMNSVGEYTMEFPSSQIAHQTKTEKDVGGVLLEMASGRLCITDWDGRRILLSDITDSKATGKPETQQLMLQKVQEVPEPISQEESHSVFQSEEQPSQESVPQMESQPQPVLKAASSEQINQKGTWDYMVQEYAQIHPFEQTDEIYLQVSPAEIKYLKPEYHVLGNNSFLLHGYYNYKYLILGKNERTENYFLGVPGIFHEREQMMASMFGFSEFKPARLENKAAGTFGYYISPVSL